MLIMDMVFEEQRTVEKKKKTLRCTQQNEIDVKTAMSTTDFLLVTGANQPECVDTPKEHASHYFMLNMAMIALMR